MTRESIHSCKARSKMDDPRRLVALVGRPNVGKSRLFNRLAGRRISIVHDEPGVTRDLVWSEIDAGFTLIDTGGIGLTPDQTPEQIAAAADEQVAFAIEAARVILFVIDGREDLSPLDLVIADRLRGCRKIPLLVVNKVDGPEVEDRVDAGALAALGFGDPVFVSAEHGRGAEALVGRILNALGPRPERPPADAATEPEERVSISFVGRPNVGKSSIGNALLNARRLLVSDVPGTTRDAVELDLDYAAPGTGETWRFRLIDTAGLRQKRRFSNPVEYFSTVRAQAAIDQSDVVFLVVDAMDGITRQDQRLAGEIIESGKALIVLVNKWDYALERFKTDPIAGYDTEAAFKKSYRAAIRKELFFLPDSPILFISAKTGLALEQVLGEARKMVMRMSRDIPTSPLNRTLHALLDARPPRRAGTGAKRFKVFYAVQVGRRPVRIRLFCNQSSRLDETYRRYLENGLIDAFRLKGCPIVFELAGKESRYTAAADAPGPAPVKTKKRVRGKNRLS